MTFKDSAHDHRTVRLDTWSRALGSAFSSEDILIEILTAELQAGRNAVKNHSYEVPVGFPEDAYSEFSSYSIHILWFYLTYREG